MGLSWSLSSDCREEETTTAVAARSFRRPSSSPCISVFASSISFFALLCIMISEKHRPRPQPEARGAGNRRPPSQPEARSAGKILSTTYSKTGGDRDSESCSICLEKFAVREKVCRLSRCKHTFHHHCLADWIRSKSICPLCRATI